MNKDKIKEFMLDIIEEYKEYVKCDYLGKEKSQKRINEGFGELKKQLNTLLEEDRELIDENTNWDIAQDPNIYDITKAENENG